MSKKTRKKPAPPEDLPNLVADLVLAGIGKERIRAMILASIKYRPGVSELNKLIDQAKEDLSDQAAEYRELASELTIVRLNDLFEKAKAAGEFKTALEIELKLTAIAGKAASAPPSAGPKITKPRLVGAYEGAMEKQRKRRRT